MTFAAAGPPDQGSIASANASAASALEALRNPSLLREVVRRTRYQPRHDRRLCGCCPGYAPEVERRERTAAAPPQIRAPMIGQRSRKIVAPMVPRPAPN